jgi:hypothetical protein
LKLLDVVVNPGMCAACWRKGGIDELIIVADKETLDDFNDTFLLCEELGVTTRVVLNFLSAFLCENGTASIRWLPSAFIQYDSHQRGTSHS